MVYIAFFSLKLKMLIYSTQKTQKVLLIVIKITILEEYLAYIDIFFKELATMLYNFLGINSCAIDLEVIVLFSISSFLLGLSNLLLQSLTKVFN